MIGFGSNACKCWFGFHWKASHTKHRRNLEDMKDPIDQRLDEQLEWIKDWKRFGALELFNAWSNGFQQSSAQTQHLMEGLCSVLNADTGIGRNGMVEFGLTHRWGIRQVCSEVRKHTVAPVAARHISATTEGSLDKLILCVRQFRDNG